MSRATRVWIGGKQVMEYDAATRTPVVASRKVVPE
jgi:hypothetical protein